MTPHSPPIGRRAMVFVIATVMLDMVGIGLVIPVLPDMIRAIAGTDLSGAAALGGWLAVAYSAMQFLCGPMIGALSDRFGRRPVLLLSVLGQGLDFALTAFAPTIAWLLVARLVSGLCGASYVTAGAYIADVTAPEERAKAFGFIGAAFGVGFVLGPAIGGLLGQFGHRVPFLVAAGFSLVNFGIGLVGLPESLSPKLRRPFSLRRANPLGAALTLGRYPSVAPLATTLFLFALAQTVYFSVWAFAVMERYGWGEGLVGLSLAAVGVAAAFNQGVLVGPAIRHLGERGAAIASLVVALLSALGYALATEGWMIFALILLGSAQGIAMPALNALMSHRAPANAQGELQGAVSSLQGMTAIIGPPVMTGLFSAFTRPGAALHLPGAPYFLAAVLIVAAIGVLVLKTRRS